MRYFTHFVLAIICLSASYAHSQYTENRYRHAIFNQVTVQNDVLYGVAPQWVWPYWNEDLKLNVYQPTGDVVTNRPLIIFAHAGGFLNGSKDVDDMVALCDSFARKGYVTATIGYRKGFNPADAESAERAVYRGVQDGKAAVRYFKENATQYGIDTNYVYIGGMSAGGFLALHVAYMDLESERPASTYGGGTVNNLGCLDCAGNNFQHTSKVRAVLNYWGAIQDTVNIVAGDVPLLLMHGTDDPTVPFTYGQPFGLFTLPYVFGSNPIQKRVQNLGIYHEFYTSSMPGLHMLDGSNNGTFENPPTSFWYDTLLPRTTDFLVKMTKPNPVKVSTDTLELCWGETATLLVDGIDNNYYKWTSFNESNETVFTQQTTETLTFTLPESGEFDIAVVEFNEVYCSSDTLWFHVIQRPEVVADFDFSIANYSDVTFTNQSVNHTVQSWNFGDGTTSTESSPAHSYTQNGTYTVQLTVLDDFGCTSTISQTVTIAHLGLSDLEAKGINVYPNPIQNELNISNSGNDAVSVDVLDLNGKQLMNVQVIEAMSTKTIATNNWLNGMYFLRITDEQGGVNIVKIVK